jgi:hypothetical protein
LRNLDDKEFQSCYNHILEDADLNLVEGASDISRISMGDGLEKFNDIKLQMESMGFNANETKYFVNYVNDNHEFLLLIHQLKMNSKFMIPQKDREDLKNILEKNTRLTIEDFQSRVLI